MRFFFLSLVLLSFLRVSAQVDFQEKSFVQKNILNRGYNDPIFLFELNSTGYYWIVNRPQGKYYIEPTHRKYQPFLIAIHDVKEDENLLVLQPKGGPNTLQKTRDYSFNDKNLDLKLNEFLESISTKPNNILQILHFVKDVYLENKNGIDYHQLKFQKNKDDRDVEDPILTSKHPIRQSKIANGTVVLGYHEHGRYDRNSLKDALLIRKQQSIYGVDNSKDDYAKADGRVYAKSHNPSGVTLSFDGKRRGNRNNGTEVLLGEEYAEKIRELHQYIRKSLSSDPNIIVMNWTSYINNMFYGNFDKLKPELTNKGMAGFSGDYFPEFHNGFLYYVHQQYGDSYYPNLTYIDFKIITTRTKKDGTGMIINQSKIPTPYRIYLPKMFEAKFEQYLDKNQFSWSGEQFDLEMEYLILDFLSQYDPNSDAFKQLIQNIYRYSRKMKPVEKKSELVKF